MTPRRRAFGWFTRETKPGFWHPVLWCKRIFLQLSCLSNMEFSFCKSETPCEGNYTSLTQDASDKGSLKVNAASEISFFAALAHPLLDKRVDRLQRARVKRRRLIRGQRLLP